jgi:polyhydroxyalkanoate synthesis repressor PhaR
MSQAPIQIKRYPNRRFYARNTSKYVSLQDLENMIRDGERLQIQDNQTGEDITRQVLAQIILDRQPEKIALFPTDMLHLILRSNELMADFLRDYFRHSLTYLEYLQRHGAAAQKLTTPMHWARAWLDELSGKRDQPAAESRAPAGAADADALIKRIEQLEARIRQLEEENGASAE